MIFKDRYDAGKRLVPRLEQYRNDPNAVVIGLPRGGVATAYEVALGLELPLDVTCPRKIGAPGNPEFAIGAITETGEGIFHEDVIAMLGVSKDYIRTAIEEKRRVAQDRLKLYRKTRKPIDLEGKTVIIVDDGLATGATMQAAIQSIRGQKAGKIIMAVPVSPPETYHKIASEVDEAICLDTPLLFQAVGQFYEYFASTQDEEVVELLERWNKNHGTDQ